MALASKIKLANISGSPETNKKAYSNRIKSHPSIQVMLSKLLSELFAFNFILFFFNSPNSCTIASSGVFGIKPDSLCGKSQ